MAEAPTDVLGTPLVATCPAYSDIKRLLYTDWVSAEYRSRADTDAGL